MKYLPLFAAVLLLTPTLEAGSKSCCQVRRCNPCGSSGTRWYKAKDGTYREMMPYREALSRAEDADDMEIELRGVREELTAAQEAAASEKEALQAELAALKKQLEDQVAATAAEKARADKADAQVAQLQESQKKAEAAAADLQKQLNEAVAAKDEALKQVTELAARVENDGKEIERLKQEALESKKVAVATEDYDADPAGDDPKAPADEVADSGDAEAEDGGSEEPAAE